MYGHVGEMIFSWMFDGDYALLKPMQGAAEIVAAKSDWPPLYDVDALRGCTIPVAAAVYAQDLYVDGILITRIHQLIIMRISANGPTARGSPSSPATKRRRAGV